MKTVNLHTDGACSGNPGKGAWCYILEYNGNEKIGSGVEEHSTNNRMELISVIEGIKSLKYPCNVNVYSDSQYVVKAINEWLQNWIKTNFKGKQNVDLWNEYMNVSEGHNVKGIWVKGHSGDEMNERCNKIAQQLTK